MDDIFLKGYPHIDLHGEDRDSARMLTNDFVNDNMMLGNYIVVFIHGVGTGIVRKSCHDALRDNKHVDYYKQDNFNHGITIAYLKK